jgi:hypothetical protein
MRQPVRGPQAEIVAAWSVSEGDRLPGGEVVVMVDREVIAGVVVITCDTWERWRLGREDRVTIAARSPRERGRPRLPRYLCLDRRVLSTAVRVGLLGRPAEREAS